MGRRTLLLLAAMVVAALGTTGVFLYVNGINQRAEEDYELVEILVATAPIAAGTTAQAAQDAGAFELRKFLRKSLSGAPALSDISGISAKVAIAPITEGELVLESKFGDSAVSSALPLPEGKLAVSVEMTDPARVAGFVGPGSQVAVFLTTTDDGGAGETTRLLLPKVSVIAAGATTVVANDTAVPAEELPPTLLTLALSQREAQKVVYASSHGQMYFALLNDASKVSATDPGTTAQNLFD